MHTSYPSFLGQSGRTPASIRYNNPGAQYPGPSSRKFKSTHTEIIGGGHKIAVFPTAVHGAAAQFDLLHRRYTDMSLQRAVAKWSGGNSVSTYLRVINKNTGLKPTDILTKEMVETPEIAIPIARAMSWQEAGRAYPIKLVHWQAAHEMAFGIRQDPDIDYLPEDETAEEFAAPDRAVRAPAETVLSKTSRKWSITIWLQRLFGISAATTFSLSSVGDIQGVKSYLDLVSGFVSSYGAVVFVLACLGAAGALQAVKWMMAEDYETGRYEPSGVQE